MESTVRFSMSQQREEIAKDNGVGGAVGGMRESHLCLNDCGSVSFVENVNRLSIGQMFITERALSRVLCHPSWSIQANSVMILI